MTREYRQPVYRPPAGAMDLLLIRHGESAPARPGTPFPMKGGHGDPPLHPAGEAQARAIANRLRTAPASAIYVTPLRRTHETAAPLLEYCGLAPLIEPDLREVHLGDWEGGEYRIRAANGDPAWQRALARHEWSEIPGAETTAALHARVRRALLRMAARHADQRVAAFVHGGVIAAALAIATGARPFAFLGAANGSISRLVIHGPNMVLRSYNDCAHLD